MHTDIYYISYTLCTYTYFNWNMLWCPVIPIKYKPIYLMTQKNQIFKSIFLKTRQGQGPKYWSHLLQHIAVTNIYT